MWGETPINVQGNFTIKYNIVAHIDQHTIAGEKVK